MKSKLAIAVTFSGWFILISYIFYEYAEYGSQVMEHVFQPKNVFEIFFHILMLSAPIGSTITGNLINEKKKLLKKTQLSEKRLRHAAEGWKVTFDSMPYSVMLVDTDFNIIRANLYTANFARMQIKDLFFKKYYKVIHKQDKPLDNCPLVKSASTQSTETLEYYDQGRNKYFKVSVTPVFGEEGTPVAYVHLLIDITDIKQKEEKLIQSRDAFFNMLKDIDTTHKELREIYHELIIAFANVIDAKSQWTRGHSERVTNYAVSMAKELGVSEKDIETLSTAGLLHDIGKIGTYDVILDKPDKLTEDEFALVRMHPIKGEEILGPIKGLERILPIIKSHHEKLDGTGYPDGLKGDEIPLLAKILCVADSYDSMTADRPYRPSPGKDYAISELKRCSGTQFEPQVVEAFIKVLERERIIK